MTLRSAQLLVSCMICLVLRADGPPDRSSHGAVVQIQQADRMLDAASLDNLTLVPTASLSLEQLNLLASLNVLERFDAGMQ